MGLGGQRKCEALQILQFYDTDSHRRTKFAHDPNNTAWTSNLADSYGQRMLQSHGWTPGASLGAHNKSYTRPKATSHIKVTLKDDNLGLGARSGPNVPQPGLDAFQGLLGRLNGKSEVELSKEQSIRDDSRRKNYAEKRFGGLNFVSGGLLVGDRIEELKVTQGVDSRLTQETSRTGSNATDSKPAVTRTDDNQSDIVDESPVMTQIKISKKSKKRKKHTSLEGPSEGHQRAVANPVGNGSLLDSASKSQTSLASAKESPSATDKALRRGEKAQRKLERRARKIERRTARAKNEIGFVVPTTGVQVKDDPTPTTTEEETSKPSFGSYKSEHIGRNAVRKRYVLQKKKAMADPRPLNEVR